jgi:hypothetical protein
VLRLSCFIVRHAAFVILIQRLCRPSVGRGFSEYP